ncbi:cytochrome P450 [Xylaria scruposa]|nr:cytochrome P450 [Xylaria scruposa]
MGEITSQSNIKASLDAKQGEGLTEREIYGNIFVINFAGHDTSSHVFTFAVYFLAANPEVQEWLSEELHSVLGRLPPHEWDYTAHFPRLKRCLAVLYETILLYTPVPVTKWTREKTQILNVGDKTLVLPPNTMMCLAYSSLQTDPRWRGSDSLTRRPSRFIKPAEVESTFDREKKGATEEEFLQPRRGTFVGWPEGAHDCPGRKFSQVEFVASIASLFRNWRVDPVTFEGGTIQASRERVLNPIKTDSAIVLLQQMLHPERAPLIWSKR